MWVYMNGSKLPQEAPNPTDLACLGNPREGFKLYNAPYGTHEVVCYATPIPQEQAPAIPPTNWDGLWAKFSIVSSDNDPRPTWMKYQVASAPWPDFGDSLVVGDDVWRVDEWGYRHALPYLGEEICVVSASPDGNRGTQYLITYLNQNWFLPHTMKITKVLAEAGKLARQFAKDFAECYFDDARRVALEITSPGGGKSRFELMDDE